MGKVKRFLFVLPEEKKLLEKIYNLNRSKDNIKRVIITEKSEDSLIKYVRNVFPKTYGFDGYSDIAIYIQEFIRKLAHFSLGIINFCGDRANNLNHLELPLFEIVYELNQLTIKIIQKREIKHLNSDALQLFIDLSDNVRVRTFANFSDFMRVHLKLDPEGTWRDRLQKQYELVKKLNGDWVLLSPHFAKYEFGKLVEFEYSKLSIKKYACFLPEEKRLFELIFSEDFNTVIVDYQKFLEKVKEDYDISNSFVVSFVQKLLDNNILDRVQGETSFFNVLVKPEEIFIADIRERNERSVKAFHYKNIRKLQGLKKFFFEKFRTACRDNLPLNEANLQAFAVFFQQLIDGFLKKFNKYGRDYQLLVCKGFEPVKLVRGSEEKIKKTKSVQESVKIDEKIEEPEKVETTPEKEVVEDIPEVDESLGGDDMANILKELKSRFKEFESKAYEVDDDPAVKAAYEDYKKFKNQLTTALQAETELSEDLVIAHNNARSYFNNLKDQKEKEAQMADVERKEAMEALKKVIELFEEDQLTDDDSSNEDVKPGTKNLYGKKFDELVLKDKMIFIVGKHFSNKCFVPQSLKTELRSAGVTVHKGSIDAALSESVRKQDYYSRHNFTPEMREVMGVHRPQTKFYYNLTQTGYNRYEKVMDILNK